MFWQWKVEASGCTIWALEKSMVTVPFSKGLDLQLVMVKIIHH